MGTEDLNLNATLFGMWGVGQTLASGMLLPHEITPRSGIPQTSFQPLNPVTQTDADRATLPVSDA